MIRSPFYAPLVSERGHLTAVAVIRDRKVVAVLPWRHAIDNLNPPLRRRHSHDRTRP